MANPHCELLPNSLCETFLTRGQTVGLVITSEAGLLSIAAVLLLFCMIIRNVSRHIRSRPTSGWRLIKSPLEVYMLSLFIADLIQGVGIAFDVRWIAQGTVTCGSYCTAQGVIQQLGETAVALSTLAIAVHTFAIILFRKGSESVLFAIIIVCFIWVYVILWVSIGAALNSKGDDTYDTPTPYWCWVGSRFTAERIAGEYFWFWFTGLTSLVLYLLLYFCLRGNIEAGGTRWWRIHIRKRPRTRLPADSAQVTEDTSPLTERPQGSRGAAKEAFIMLLYPVCYVGLILPLSIVRWIDFVLEARNPEDPNNILQNVPSAATFIVQSIFAMSGVVNVALLLFTRPGLLLLGEPPTRSPPPPVFDSSESVASGTREQTNMRLRPLAPVFHIGAEDPQNESMS